MVSVCAEHQPGAVAHRGCPLPGSAPQHANGCVGRHAVLERRALKALVHNRAFFHAQTGL